MTRFFRFINCRYAAVMTATLTAMSFTACKKENQHGSDSDTWQKTEGFVWNTSYHITYNGAKELEDSIAATLRKTGSTLSVFDTSSLVNQVNRQDTTPVNTDFIRVYIMSKKLNRLTGGAFDPTLSPLITAWGFGPGHTPTADTTRIDSILEYTGIDRTRIERDAIIKDDRRIQFNFSAIAKGYGCDAVGEMFIRNSVEDFMIEIGGEIMAHGKSPRNGKWRVSVDRPIMSSTDIIHESQVVVEFTDMGMATSGNYRNFHSSENGVYGHTISAHTGRPVATDIISATVLAPTAMEADGLSTAFMAMGSEKAKTLGKRLRRPVMLVLSDSTVWTTPQFAKLIDDIHRKQ